MNRVIISLKNYFTFFYILLARSLYQRLRGRERTQPTQSLPYMVCSLTVCLALRENFSSLCCDSDMYVAIELVISMEGFESRTSQTWAYIREQSGKTALWDLCYISLNVQHNLHTFHRDDLEDPKDQCVPQSLKTKQRRVSGRMRRRRRRKKGGRER